jgi:hypothetical protein
MCSPTSATGSQNRGGGPDALQPLCDARTVRADGVKLLAYRILGPVKATGMAASATDVPRDARYAHVPGSSEG